MIHSISLKNYGPITELEWNHLSSINLIVGKNGSGKSIFLKALYSALRTIETYKKGNNIKSVSEVLFDKLYWTFQINQLGDLVKKNGEENSLSFSLKDTTVNAEFSYSFGKDTHKQIQNVQNTITRKSNSVYLPAKEVLSLHSIIKKSREQELLFGFDDTYLDLVKALELPKIKGNNYEEFTKARKQLLNLLDGKVDYDEKSGDWFFSKGSYKFPISIASEGVRKISILDTLLGNRYLDLESVILIDEPESALHPAAISNFMEIIDILSDRGIQFFIASHSYFVIKKLFLIALKKQKSIPILTLETDTIKTEDLLRGMVENTIINESIRLYEEEIVNAGFLSSGSGERQARNQRTEEQDN